MKIKKILAGIDFGQATEKVFSYSLYFAEALKASLTLLYVIDYLVTPPSYIFPYIDKEKRTAEKKFALLKKKLENAGIKAGSEVTVGRLHESFKTEAEKVNADMLVLGFRSHALRRSSSEKLIKGLQMPMLVVRGEKTDSVRNDSVKIRKILCPVDFSEGSVKALSVARELKDYFFAKLDVIHVFPSHIIKKKINKSMDKEKVVKELIEHETGRLSKILKDSGIRESGKIDEGEPYKKIISFSKEEDIDLIVIGARGLGFIKGMIIGSVTDSLLKTSPCPVIVIH
ncbi:MAG: hypothetical protein A2Y97_02865 [Nitrospirae bacterium RBG_13_39_12]|nr:MAG: hypothetical protein A2Y97_02865 [Nitrospirae bacterium RBG_13_39_12]